MNKESEIRKDLGIVIACYNALQQVLKKTQEIRFKDLRKSAQKSISETIRTYRETVINFLEIERFNTQIKIARALEKSDKPMDRKQIKSVANNGITDSSLRRLLSKMEAIGVISEASYKDKVKYNLEIRRKKYYKAVEGAADRLERIKDAF